MTRQSLIDSAVRQAYREDPRAAHILLGDYDVFPDITLKMADSLGVAMPWAHFVARVRNLYEVMVTHETFNPHRQTSNPEIELPEPDNNGRALVRSKCGQPSDVVELLEWFEKLSAETEALVEYNKQNPPPDHNVG